MKADTVILAAGHGTRMKSDLAKILHPISGRPMIQWVIDACRQAVAGRKTLVVGPEVEEIREEIEGDVEFAIQRDRLGTAHAVQQAEGSVSGDELVLVVNGDLALITAESLAQLVETQFDHDGPFTLLSAVSDEPRGFGRLIRDEKGSVVAIQEAAHATPEQLAIKELNVGAYCFQADWLWANLPKLDKSPKGEYYLTDLVELAAAAGLSVASSPVSEPEETIGINTRVHLAQAEKAMRARINRRWMEAGVTMQDPERTYIEPEVELAKDVTILANCQLIGSTRVGAHSVIGPNSTIRDSQIGKRCEIMASTIEEAVLEDEVDVGPYSHMREGAYLESGVHIGNYGEVKNSRLARGVKMGHFSYLGDATVGEDVNIGAGTITCNYDGEKKNPTIIEEGAFIGSDTMLVAPVKIGAGARTGAGSVVTKDVPPGRIAVGVPARVIRKTEE